MKNKLFLICIILMTFLAGCFSSNSDSSSPTITTKKDVNVAASSNGATASSEFNSSTVKNLIDEDDTTTWVSATGIPAVIKFSTLNKIKTITLKKPGEGIMTSGSNPDILIELSSDGSNYRPSAMTKFSTNSVPCNSYSIGSELLVCYMDDFETQYIRLTSQNGKAFEFKELEVISYK